MIYKDYSGTRGFYGYRGQGARLEREPKSFGFLGFKAKIKRKGGPGSQYISMLVKFYQ
jgi:hypothetical protein